MLLIVSPAELRKVIRDGCNVGLPGAPIVPIRGEHAGAKPTSSLGGPEASGRYQGAGGSPTPPSAQANVRGDGERDALRDDSSLPGGMQLHRVHRRT